jgi:hypothetical protein
MGKPVELAIPPGRSNVGPRFTVGSVDEGARISIYDDDFGFDAALALSGDWSQEDKVRYAAAVCAALNSANIPVRDDSQSSGGGVKHVES